ncbi:MAG: protein-L-isoaspartate O-methyltransferase, partial [Chlamydiota bacterium]|nr:protein-L-isoaspartate O-methyltransferase [Chlamydiota bacterium]
MKTFKDEDWQRMRADMVEMQLRRRGISSERVLEAFNAIPRHEFVSLEDQDQAYEDHPIAIGCGQTISQPYMVAVMVELLSLTGDEKVLEIGTGSAYLTAILSKLA